MRDTTFSPFRAIRAALMVPALLLLAACAMPPDYWPSPNAQKVNTVEWIVLSHEVQFVPGTPMVEAGEHQRLANFLRSVEADDAARLFIDADRPNVRNGLAARREATTHAHLARLGFATERLPADPEREKAAGPRTDPDSVSVIVGRYVVTLPDCPDMRKPGIGDYTNLPSTNFGCATATTLGLMVADPRDLVRGSAMGPADGARAARSVRAYRAGLLPAPRRTTGAAQTSVGMASGSTGGAK